MKKHYSEVLLDGCSIECNDLSLCRINNHYTRTVKTDLYQVHSDNRKAKFSMMYKSPFDAIDKFLEIKGKIS
jgi:hypothetical protein|tara:strand:- start:182 stop:397 length:216 start_codon:yes stop_codon:yes gene_type:complete